jgi:DDE superfamily endonuclease
MIKQVADAYPEAETIHLVIDKLSTHTEKSLTDRYGVEKGKAVWDRFTVHYTPVQWQLAQPGRN